MNIDTHIYKNDYLMQTCFSYLNCRDLSSASQVSKIFHRTSNNFNHCWREQCNEYFCGSYSHYSIIVPEIKDFEREMFSKTQSDFDWKLFLSTGLSIKNNWLILSKNTEYPYMDTEIEEIQSEIYTSLKEHFSFPRLRKENFHLENNMNTSFQTFLFDFLYEEQDLYDLYNDNVRSLDENDIHVRRTDLPLSCALENLQVLIKEFNSEDQLCKLTKLRWYNEHSLKSANILNEIFAEK